MRMCVFGSWRHAGQIFWSDRYLNLEIMFLKFSGVNLPLNKILIENYNVGQSVLLHMKFLSFYNADIQYWLCWIRTSYRMIFWCDFIFKQNSFCEHSWWWINASEQFHEHHSKNWKRNFVLNLCKTTHEDCLHSCDCDCAVISCDCSIRSLSVPLLWL